MDYVSFKIIKFFSELLPGPDIGSVIPIVVESRFKDQFDAYPPLVTELIKVRDSREQHPYLTDKV